LLNQGRELLWGESGECGREDLKEISVWQSPFQRGVSCLELGFQFSEQITVLVDGFGQLAGDLTLRGGLLDLVASQALEQDSDIDPIVVPGQRVEDLLALRISDGNVNALETLLEDSEPHLGLGRPLLHAIEEVLWA
jgi:hypothetical protein